LGILVEVPESMGHRIHGSGENERAGIHRRRIRVVVTDFNEMTAKHPKVIASGEPPSCAHIPVQAGVAGTA